MMISSIHRLPAIGLALALAGCAPCPVPLQPAPAASPEQAPFEPSRALPVDAMVGDEPARRIIEVQMLTTQQGASGEFSPRTVRARQGDVLRFRMADGNSIHNVSFASFANDTRGVPLPPAGPLLTQQGQSWQMRIDLPPGRYEFACLPHHATGHRGVLIVEER